MRSRLLIALGVLAAIAITAGGCYLNDSRDRGADRLSMRNPMAPLEATAAPPDSHPTPGPTPHPTPDPRLTVAFVSADTVDPGQTSITRWSFGNSGHSTLAVAWTLTDQQGWPGFPRQGTLSLAPLSTQALAVPVAVPDSTSPGFYALTMTATSGSRSATAMGTIRVAGPDSTGTAGR